MWSRTPPSRDIFETFKDDNDLSLALACGLDERRHGAEDSRLPGFGAKRAVAIAEIGKPEGHAVYEDDSVLHSFDRFDEFYRRLYRSKVRRALGSVTRDAALHLRIVAGRRRGDCTRPKAQRLRVFARSGSCRFARRRGRTSTLSVQDPHDAIAIELVDHADARIGLFHPKNHTRFDPEGLREHDAVDAAMRNDRHCLLLPGPHESPKRLEAPVASSV